uniref:Uncharacterized protein n=1 Tax=Fagus sylvatica TaxID=28930 RepID=A0A2N9IU10_FAGSY
MANEGGKLVSGPFRGPTLRDSLIGTRVLVQRRQTPSSLWVVRGLWALTTSWTARSYLSKVVTVEGLGQAPDEGVAWIVLTLRQANWRPMPGGREGLKVDSWNSDRPTGNGKTNLCLCMRRQLGGSPVSEKDDDFIPVSVESGACLRPLVSLRRPKLDSDGHNRVLRGVASTTSTITSTSYDPSFLLCTRSALNRVRRYCRCKEINQRRMATAKLNREKLRKMMSQQDEAPLTLGKKRKTESSSMEKVPTLPRDASLASRRGQDSVVTKDDIGEYDKVNTDVIKGFDRTHGDRQSLHFNGRRHLIEAESPIVGGCPGQPTVDGARQRTDLGQGIGSWVRCRPSSKAKEKYSELDFEAFQPFDDDESVMPVEEVGGGTTSVDPSARIDDAAS